MNYTDSALKVFFGHKIQMKMTQEESRTTREAGSSNWQGEYFKQPSRH